MKLKGKWPEHLIVPSESQFQHEGRWVMVYNDKGTSDEYYAAAELDRVARRGLMNEPDREEVKFHCGTSCCLVGWAALAFGESGCAPSDIRNPATGQFLEKFLEFAGRTATDNDDFSLQFLARKASKCYEGDDEATEMPPRRARNIWKKTAEHFGYDAENLLEE